MKPKNQLRDDNFSKNIYKHTGKLKPEINYLSPLSLDLSPILEKMNCRQMTFQEIKDEFYPQYINDEDLEKIKKHLNGK